ncbi:MAG: hypothetical protein LQ343_000542 [Gyalolechia ehrenbergii]|nr:MAG: hypothetical protein LQ343_000542 [Gyalolechia ehrenbergii]
MDRSLPDRTSTTPTRDEWDTNREYHDILIQNEGADYRKSAYVEECKNTPLFSAEVARKLAAHLGRGPFPQYGFLAKKEKIFSLEDNPDQAIPDAGKDAPKESEDGRIFLNMNAPLSVFLCGSQGSGKSHTLSCIMEEALKDSRLGRLPQPMAGIVFHYDKFSRGSHHEPCEAAYLCSTGIPVKVLVPLSSINRMERAYGALPGLPPGAPKPVVSPLLLREEHLDVSTMMKLMKVDSEKGGAVLYMEVVFNILRAMSINNGEAQGVDYDAFLGELQRQKFSVGQNDPLRMRLQLLEAVMEKLQKEWLRKWYKKRPRQGDIWSFQPGSLTIIDLSDPWINEGAACALFDVCLLLFLELGPKTGKIVALDEAHTFMTGTDQSSTFTESLLSVIRKQRHTGTRVVIATQEPTISPKLLDLCSMTIVHRFTSPDWLQALKAHLAGVSDLNGEDSQRNIGKIFRMIVNLQAGQALLFSPSALLEAAESESTTSDPPLNVQKLGLRYVKMKVRKRLTEDGGRSILAVRQE